GGQVRMGVPEFRLPHDVLNEDIQAILDMGIAVNYGQSIDSQRMAELAGQYDAVLLATGANVPRSIRLEGLGDDAVIEGLNFMKRFNDGDPVDIVGGDVVIIGGGFTAVDCARSVRRLAPDAKVSIMYRRGPAQMAASEEEFEQMEAEGIAIQTLVTPVRAVAAGDSLQAVTFIRNRLGKPDESGKPAFTPIEGSEFEVSCQQVILAIGQTPDKTIIPDGAEITDDHQTSQAGLFVAGDFAMGNGDVINAVADGKAASDQIDEYLMGQVRRKTIVCVEDAEGTGRIRDFDLLEPVGMDVLPTDLRDRIAEVEQGFSADQAEIHAKRCYFCNFKFEIDQDKCIHCDWCIKVSPRECIHRLKTLEYDPATFEAKFEKVDASRPEEATYIWIESDNCIRCGNCYGVCPVDAITLRKADRIDGCESV
ncbi:MAG: FAD-dependent oxidoreductase, partial [Planctomycetota bacterium]